MKCPLHVIIILTLLSALFASGCADDLCRDDMFLVGEGEARMGFSVEGIFSTRAGQGDDLESRIDHAYLLFYPADASIGNAVPLAAVRAEVGESDPTALTFKMPLLLQEDTDYRLVAVANADDCLPEGYGSFTEYLAAWVSGRIDDNESVSLHHSGPILAGDVESLPMRGMLPDDGYFRFSMRNGVYQVSASLSFRRLVARIDVANIVKEGFSVEGVALCNWRDAVSIISDAKTGEIRGILSASGREGDNVSFVDVEDVSGFQQLQSAIYAFPSSAAESRIDDEESTALIIKAIYGDDESPSYYRVNVGTHGKASEVKANTKYLVTIQSVKGRGAVTPEEAYAASESQLVLSVVTDWDIDGGCAMDDYGNFIIVSRGVVEFDADFAENAEVKVLTSKGLSWNVEYLPDDEASADAFNVAKTTSSILISPKNDNDAGSSFSGISRVSALTPQGTALTVDISLGYKAGDVPVGPVIPWDMPYALVPLDAERVRIDHEARTIEIDGFDPDCFNSFIDVPFRVYINRDETLSNVTISTDLEWPLEGRMAQDKSSIYHYCKNSFLTSGVRQVVKSDGQVPSENNSLGKTPITVGKDEEIYISVGAMGPDDPAIVRAVHLTGSDREIIYTLRIKPRTCIINDVILTGPSGDSWLVMDRNIQDFKVYDAYVGLGAAGSRRQPYNYTSIQSLGGIELMVPFKFLNDNSAFSEIKHELYQGKYYLYSQRSNLKTDNTTTISRLSWLRRYCNSSESPFYESAEGSYCYKNWIFPSDAVMELMRIKIRLSKMRMYFVSDVYVKDLQTEIPVCCYLPYGGPDISDTSTESYGYYSSWDGEDPSNITIMYMDNMEFKLYSVPTRYGSQPGLSRLVRPLTADELEAYKTNYLGYGSQPHRLTICHPDTYESTLLGWIPY